MPIDLQHAEAMLNEDECPFTRDQLARCIINPSVPLFEWSGIDMYLVVNQDNKKKNAKH